MYKSAAKVEEKRVSLQTVVNEHFVEMMVSLREMAHRSKRQNFEYTRTVNIRAQKLECC